MEQSVAKDMLTELKQTPDKYLTNVTVSSMSEDKLLDSLSKGSEIEGGGDIPADNPAPDIPGNTPTDPDFISYEPTKEVPVEKVMFMLQELLPVTIAVDGIDMLFGGLSMVMLRWQDVPFDKSQILASAAQKKTMEKALTPLFQQTQVGTKNPLLTAIIGIGAVYITNITLLLADNRLNGDKSEATIKEKKKETRGRKPGIKNTVKYPPKL